MVTVIHRRGEGGGEETLDSTLAQASLSSFSSYKVSQPHQNCCLSNLILYTHTNLIIQYMQEQYILSHVYCITENFHLEKIFASFAPCSHRRNLFHRLLSCANKSTQNLRQPLPHGKKNSLR